MLACFYEIAEEVRGVHSVRLSKTLLMRVQ